MEVIITVDRVHIPTPHSTAAWSDVTADMEAPKGVPTKTAPCTAAHRAQNRLQPVGWHRNFTPHRACPFQH